MKGWDPTGEAGPKNPLPDMVQIKEPGIEKVFTEPTSEQRGAGAEPIVPAPVDDPYAAGDAYAAPEATYQEQEGVEPAAF
jgi:small subunit ribosomal protein S3e